MKQILLLGLSLHLFIGVHSDLTGDMGGFHDPSDHMPGDDGKTFMATLLGKYYDRFEDLSNEERQKEFSKLIPEIDQNGDMTITSDELKDWLIGQIEKQASKFSDDAVNMTNIDHNSDGKLSLEEMMEDFKKHQPRADGHDDPTLLEREQKKTELKFKMADKDENGFLSNEEVPRIYLPEHFADMEDLFEKHFVLEYDSNGDGIITRKEFVAHSQHDPNYETIEDVHRQFESYDRDEDGSLSIQEIQIASREMQPLNEVRQEIATIFKVLDKYKHDYLTYDELAESHQYFTDKDVTLPDAGGDEDYEHDEL